MRNIRYKYYGAYINDDWKVTPKLTLNLGIRYEYVTAPYGTHDLQSNFIVGPNKLVFPEQRYSAHFTHPGVTRGEISRFGVDPRGLVKGFTNNWAPRAGLAYQIGPKTVFRAGAGIFYAEADAAGASGRRGVQSVSHDLHSSRRQRLPTDVYLR